MFALSERVCFYSKYSFKAKKPKLDTGNPTALSLHESMLALLSSQSADDSGNAEAGPSSGPDLEQRVVASISAEIAAALAQAQARIYEEEDDDEEEESEAEIAYADGIGPNTSGIRGGGAPSSPLSGAETQSGGGDSANLLGDIDEAFSIPLRTRKSNTVGQKRKR